MAEDKPKKKPKVKKVKDKEVEIEIEIDSTAEFEELLEEVIALIGTGDEFDKNVTIRGDELLLNQPVALIIGAKFKAEEYKVKIKYKKKESIDVISPDIIATLEIEEDQ